MRTPAEILKTGPTEKEKDIIFQVLKIIPLRVRDCERRANYFGHEVTAIIRAIVKAYRPPKGCESCPGFGLMATHGYGVEVVEGEKADEKSI